MSKAENKVRQWLAANCPALLERLEQLQAARAARLAMHGHGYPDRDIEEQERAVWALVARVPGYRDLVDVACREEETDEG